MKNKTTSIYSSPSSEDYENLRINNNYKVVERNEEINSINSPIVEKANTFLNYQPQTQLLNHQIQNSNLFNVNVMNTINSLSSINSLNTLNTLNSLNAITTKNEISSPQNHLTNIQSDFRKKFKTEICKFYELDKECKYGDKVMFFLFLWIVCFCAWKSGYKE